VELAIAAALGLLGPEHRPDVVPTRDGLARVHRLADVHPRRARRALGAQRQRLTAALEGEHLLLDDFARAARRFLEQFALLEQRRAQLLVAVRLDGAAEGALQTLPAPNLVGEKVVHPLDGT